MPIAKMCLCAVNKLLTQLTHSVAAASRNAYWRPTLAVVCSPLDSGQINVMTDRHDRPIADFKDRERPPLIKN